MVKDGTLIIIYRSVFLYSIKNFFPMVNTSTSTAELEILWFNSLIIDELKAPAKPLLEVIAMYSAFSLFCAKEKRYQNQSLRLHSE